ncbi:hypothetical protein NHX12_012670 [Muraenolepis orangiensis]|uniref:Secreted protein n=1 Tax=Muraenolepis orangiensis TaxID=630683 RepID=A0A9Q0I5N4_9TELE|nr:hypothetical protein NHX12_012670 [Muraenolepis orangiensis]
MDDRGGALLLLLAAQAHTTLGPCTKASTILSSVVPEQDLESLGNQVGRPVASIAMLTDSMVTDSPTPSLRSGLTATTDGDSVMSSASVPCCHFLSANVINVGECG